MKKDVEQKVRALAKKLDEFGLALQIPAQSGDKSNEGITSIPTKPETEDRTMGHEAKTGTAQADVSGLPQGAPAPAPAQAPMDPVVHGLNGMRHDLQAIHGELMQRRSFKARSIDTIILFGTLTAAGSVVALGYHAITRPKVVATTDLPVLKK